MFLFININENIIIDILSEGNINKINKATHANFIREN